MEIYNNMIEMFNIGVYILSHNLLLMLGGKRDVAPWLSDRSLMVDLLSYFSFQPAFHDWYNKGRGI